MRRFLLHGGLAALLGGTVLAPAFGQSLAEAARQEQARKSAAPPAQHVYTNDDFSAHAAEVAPASDQEKDSKPSEAKSDTAEDTKKPTADELRAKILAQKQKIRQLETRIAEIQKRLDERESIGTVTVGQRVYLQSYNTSPGLCYVPGMGYNPYQTWCDEPLKLTAEMKRKQTDLEKERATLEELQEQARRLGYRSNFYYPD